MPAETPGALTWEPTAEETDEARITHFLSWLEVHRGVRLRGYRELWRWSVDELSAFWESVVEFFDLLGDGWDGPTLAEERMPGALWFPRAKLNFAENVLRPASDPLRRDETAILNITEEGEQRSYSWGELAGEVGALANWLREQGVGAGDRVAAVLPNVPEAIVGLLASAAVGAVWTIHSPELSVDASLSRLSQLDPRVLVGVESYRYNGRLFEVGDRLAQIEAGLPSLAAVLLVGDRTDTEGRHRYADAVSRRQSPRFERVAFSHPLWILFSSGTTGAPKGIVHGHGGILLEAVKGPGLNQDMGPGDRYYVAANTSWMVWNTLTMNLATGASVVTYAGSPTYSGPQQQFRILAESCATMFATGAAYLQLSERAGISPGESFDLSALRSILSTGSPLPVSTWQWVHAAVKEHVHLGSDTGGTDISGGFIGSNPLEPVHAGLLQGPLLGVAVESWAEDGRRVIDDVGDLVVRRPMPSMPVSFWNDADGRRYQAAYFQRFPGVWTQGDWITETATGEFVVHGRSDATLNRQGVRIGPVDIYEALRGVSGVAESLVIGVELEGGGYYMPLFVQLDPGAELDDEMREQIAERIRSRTSPRHVPDEVIAVPAIPLTHANKKLEVPIKRLYSGHPPEEAINLGSVANPESLNWFLDRAQEFHRARM